MFEDQTVELLPPRTTMKKWGRGGSQNGNIAIAVAVNAGNVNFDGDQLNVASASAAAGSNFFSFGSS
jgi:hypothetical protein